MLCLGDQVGLAELLAAGVLDHDVVARSGPGCRSRSSRCRPWRSSWSVSKAKRAARVGRERRASRRRLRRLRHRRWRRSVVGAGRGAAVVVVVAPAGHEGDAARSRANRARAFFIESFLSWGSTVCSRRQLYAQPRYGRDAAEVQLAGELGLLAGEEGGHARAQVLGAPCCRRSRAARAAGGRRGCSRGSRRPAASPSARSGAPWRPASRPSRAPAPSARRRAPPRRPGPPRARPAAVRLGSLSSSSSALLGPITRGRK